MIESLISGVLYIDDTCLLASFTIVLFFLSSVVKFLCHSEPPVGRCRRIFVLFLAIFCVINEMK